MRISEIDRALHKSTVRFVNRPRFHIKSTVRISEIDRAYFGNRPCGFVNPAVRFENYDRAIYVYDRAVSQIDRAIWEIRQCNFGNTTVQSKIRPLNDRSI